MLCGHVTTIGICIGSAFIKHKTPPLKFSTDECSDEIWAKVNQTSVTMTMNDTQYSMEEV